LLVLGVFGIIVSLIYETRRQDSIWRPRFSSD
jgi:hypothetical protein